MSDDGIKGSISASNPVFAPNAMPTGTLPPPTHVGTKRGLLMLSKAQQGDVIDAKKKPIHRTSSWPPISGPAEFEPVFDEQGAAGTVAVPAANVAPQSALLQGHTLMSAPGLWSRSSSSVASSLFAERASAFPASSMEKTSPRNNRTADISLSRKLTESASSSARQPDKASDIAQRGPAPSCYCIESGKVSSVAVTDDGEFLFVAFVLGSVRVFHLAAGNADAEDRFGFEVFNFNSQLNKGDNLYVRLEVGSSRLGSGVTGHSRHLFAGVKVGTNRMMILDLNSLRSSCRTRGYISFAGA
jgi:hypothetical protein